MPRPRTPLLSTDRIGDAAMELVDAGRPFGVNAVARHLGVTPSSSEFSMTSSGWVSFAAHFRPSAFESS